MAIESGKIVVVTIVLNVPVMLPPNVDPQQWAVGCVAPSNLGVVPLIRSVEAKLGTLTPNPILQT